MFLLSPSIRGLYWGQVHPLEIKLNKIKFLKKIYGGAVRLTNPSISIRVTAKFYEISKERHSIRAAYWSRLKLLRFESDLCELDRL